MNPIYKEFGVIFSFYGQKERIFPDTHKALSSRLLLFGSYYKNSNNPILVLLMKLNKHKKSLQNFQK